MRRASAPHVRPNFDSSGPRVVSPYKTARLRANALSLVGKAAGSCTSGASAVLNGTAACTKNMGPAPLHAGLGTAPIPSGVRVGFTTNANAGLTVNARGASPSTTRGGTPTHERTGCPRPHPTREQWRNGPSIPGSASEPETDTGPTLHTPPVGLNNEGPLGVSRGTNCGATEKTLPPGIFWRLGGPLTKRPALGATGAASCSFWAKNASLGPR